MYKLLSIDNEASVGSSFVGLVYEFKYDGVRFYFGRLYSSLVKSIKRSDEELVVTTRNSVYTFKEV